MYTEHKKSMFGSQIPLLNKHTIAVVYAVQMVKIWYGKVVSIDTIKYKTMI